MPLRGLSQRLLMATALTNELTAIGRRAADFAQRHIAHRHDLHTMKGFPHDIWQSMADEGLLGIGISTEYGGTGGRFLDISVAGEALSRAGHNMGISLSWVIHNVVSRYFIGEFGNSGQRDTLLPLFAKGIKTASIAISEPESMAHPKYLKTNGGQHNEGFVINGYKSFLTNGQIADFFIVLTITGNKGVKKRFTSFVIPKETKGIAICKNISLDFLKPSPHCEIRLENCLVPASCILGEKGTAYETMAKPFREIEEVCLMGPIIGGMKRQIELFIDLIRNSNVVSSDEIKGALGEQWYTIDTLLIIALEAASMLDSGLKHPEFLSLLLSFRTIANRFQSLFKTLHSRLKTDERTELAVITKDLIKSINIANYVSTIKKQKMGEDLLIRKE